MLFFTIISLVAYFTFTAENDYEVPLQPAGLYQIMMWCVVGLCIIVGLVILTHIKMDKRPTVFSLRKEIIQYLATTDK